MSKELMNAFLGVEITREAWDAGMDRQITLGWERGYGYGLRLPKGVWGAEEGSDNWYTATARTDWGDTEITVIANRGLGKVYRSAITAIGGEQTWIQPHGRDWQRKGTVGAAVADLVDWADQNARPDTWRQCRGIKDLGEIVQQPHAVPPCDRLRSQATWRLKGTRCPDCHNRVSKEAHRRNRDKGKIN